MAWTRYFPRSTAPSLLADAAEFSAQAFPAKDSASIAKIEARFIVDSPSTQPSRSVARSDFLFRVGLDSRTTSRSAHRAPGADAWSSSSPGLLEQRRGLGSSSRIQLCIRFNASLSKTSVPSGGIWIAGERVEKRSHKALCDGSPAVIRYSDFAPSIQA